MKTLQVMGPGCKKCNELESLAKAALQESGTEGEVVKITEFKDIAAMGVFSTPALALDGKVLAVGRVPSKKEILEWLQG